MNCKYCNRRIDNSGGLFVHEKHCKENPNRVQRKRSPDAGIKKGQSSSMKGRKIGRAAYWDEKYPLENVLVENSTYGRTHLKKRIIDNNLINYQCSCCGIDAMWQGKPMPLILVHINGINNDN